MSGLILRRNDNIRRWAHKLKVLSGEIPESKDPSDLKVNCWKRALGSLLRALRTCLGAVPKQISENDPRNHPREALSDLDAGVSACIGLDLPQ